MEEGLFPKDFNLPFSPSPLGSAIALLSHILSLGPMDLFKPKQDSLVRTLMLLVSDWGRESWREVTLVTITTLEHVVFCFFLKHGSSLSESLNESCPSKKV